MTDKTPEEIKAEEIVSVTKKGFNLADRLKNRGLRKATITLYLDEEKGAELGDALDIRNALGEVTGRNRTGIIGDIEGLKERRGKTKQDDADALAAIDAEIAELEARRDALIEELSKTALVVSIQAVPPVILKDSHRRARQHMGITEKNVPEDREDEYGQAQLATLMSVMITRIVDNSTGEVNEGIDYADSVALIDYLPPSQFDRLDEKLGTVQYTDAISRSIEGQEDFS